MSGDVYGTPAPGGSAAVAVPPAGGDGTPQGGSDERMEDVLDDLSCRFLLNLPASEFESFERLFFAIESAHWYYDDFFRERNPRLPSLSLKSFASKLFAHTPLLQPYLSQVDEHFQAFRNYKQEVPKCGTAMLNLSMERVVLVMGWGSKRWSFPKGKLAKDELELDCAVRETEEETGYDCAHLARTEDCMSITPQGVRTTIFIVRNVPDDTPFEPRTRKEVARIDWHCVSQLPEDYSSPKANKFHTVVPFVRRLKTWIRKRGGHPPRGETGGASVVSTPVYSAPAAAAAGASPHAVGGDSAGNTTPAAAPPATPSGVIPAGASSARKAGGGGGRKRVAAVPSRNTMTFGTPDKGLSERERQELFERYVEMSERRRQEIDTSEYFRIVDSIVLGNEAAARGVASRSSAEHTTPPPRKASRDAIKRASTAQNDDEAAAPPPSPPPPAAKAKAHSVAAASPKAPTREAPPPAQDVLSTSAPPATELPTTFAFDSAAILQCFA